MFALSSRKKESWWCCPGSEHMSCCQGWWWLKATPGGSRSVGRCSTSHPASCCVQAGWISFYLVETTGLMENCASYLYPSRTKNQEIRELAGLQRQLEYLWNTLDTLNENDRKFYTCSATAWLLLADVVTGLQVLYMALSLLGAFGFCSWNGTEISGGYLWDEQHMDEVWSVSVFSGQTWFGVGNCTRKCC